MQRNHNNEVGQVPTMKEFFDRADVKALQDVQRTNHWGSKAHRKAFYDLTALAVSLGVDADWLGDYDS